MQEQNNVIQLNAVETGRFNAGMENPAQPNANLQKAMDAYQDRIASGELRPSPVALEGIVDATIVPADVDLTEIAALERAPAPTLLPSDIQPVAIDEDGPVYAPTQEQIARYYPDDLLPTPSREAHTISEEFLAEHLVPPPENLHRVNLHQFLLARDGRFVGIDFVKKDGSQRSLNGRLGVLAHQNGGVNNVVADHRPYITIYDVKADLGKGGYRTVNLATVTRVRADRRVYDIVG